MSPKLKEQLFIWGLSIATTFVIVVLYSIFIAAPIKRMSQDMAKFWCQQMHLDCKFPDNAP